MEDNSQITSSQNKHYSIKDVTLYRLVSVPNAGNSSITRWSLRLTSEKEVQDPTLQMRCRTANRTEAPVKQISWKRIHIEKNTHSIMCPCIRFCCRRDVSLFDQRLIQLPRIAIGSGRCVLMRGQTRLMYHFYCILATTVEFSSAHTQRLLHVIIGDIGSWRWKKWDANAGLSWDDGLGGFH